MPSTMMREVYEYNRDGPRDPFISSLSTTDLRPNLLDLRLLMTVVDEPGLVGGPETNAFDRRNPQKTLRGGRSARAHARDEHSPGRSDFHTDRGVWHEQARFAPAS